VTPLDEIMQDGIMMPEYENATLAMGSLSALLFSLIFMGGIAPVFVVFGG
jgi:hypothetical protein